MELRPHGLTAKLFARQTFSPNQHTINKYMSDKKVRRVNFWYSEFDRFREIAPCRNLPVLYPQKKHLTLALKLFRREPAITRFDYLFTPYHKLSHSFARLKGSDLLRHLRRIHPIHGKFTWFRV